MNDVAASLGTDAVTVKDRAARPEVAPSGFNAREDGAAGARLERAVARLEKALHEKAGGGENDGAGNDDTLAALRHRIETLTDENDRLQGTHRVLGERLDATIARIKRLMQG